MKFYLTSLATDPSLLLSKDIKTCDVQLISKVLNLIPSSSYRPLAGKNLLDVKLFHLLSKSQSKPPSSLSLSAYSGE